MRTLKSPSYLPLTATIFAIFAGHATLRAQTLTGTVTDTSGATVPDATVTVKSEKTGEERVVKSNEVGLYRVTNLAPTTYSVEGKAADLGPTQYANIPLIAGQERVLNLILQPATLNQEVNVSSGELVT